MEDRSDQGKRSELRLQATACPGASLHVGMGHRVEAVEGLKEPCWAGLLCMPWVPGLKFRVTVALAIEGQKMLSPLQDGSLRIPVGKMSPFADHFIINL